MNTSEWFKPKQPQISVPMKMTKAEKKKQIKDRRKEYQKEIQEKIKYGLMPAPPPKVKLNNFMRVMANQAVQDPTKVEQEVKRLVAERQEKHVQTMESRKLTKEQKKEKMLKKLKRDSAKECRVCLFVLRSVRDHKIQAKIKKNAEDLALNGFCLMPSRAIGAELPTVIAIEAGPKYTKFFKRLVLHRIDWDLKKGRKKGLDEEIPAQETESSTHCKLVWEGVVSDHMFPKWAIREIRSEAEGRKIFADRGVEEYWDMAVSQRFL